MASSVGRGRPEFGAPQCPARSPVLRRLADDLPKLPRADFPGRHEQPLLLQVPAVQLPPALAQRALATLLWPGDEAVKRNRHMARGVRHRHPPKWLRLASGPPTLSQVMAGVGRPGANARP